MDSQGETIKRVNKELSHSQAENSKQRAPTEIIQDMSNTQQFKHGLCLIILDRISDKLLVQKIVI